MDKKPTVFLSNSVEKLRGLLGEKLFLKKEKPFEKKMVFLPDMALKTALMTSFVSDKNLSVVLGIDFTELGPGVQTLFKLCSGKKLLFPPLDLLTLQLEAFLEAPGLAPKLSVEFLKFGKYGGSQIENFPDCWQKKHWDQIFSKWSYPYQILQTSLTNPHQSIEIHLYNFPFLPKLYHLFFDRLSKYFTIYYYQFSPCQEFWSDSVTDFEKMRLLEKNQQLSFYLDSGNPLLSNLGKVGRETFRVLEEEDFIFDEHYVLPSSSSYLAHLQKEVLTLSRSKSEKDPSVLLLPAPTKLREVEILYTKLIELNVKASDVQIFAPDIATYAPLIEFVFNGDDSPFDFTIYDLPESSSFQAFFDLLSLDRFKPEDVFKLFSSSYFSSFSEKETKAVKEWIGQSGVKWGVDKKHRKALLPGILDQTENGTWKKAFDLLLTQLIFIPKEPTDWDPPYLDFSSAQTLGKAICLIDSLRKDLEFLKSACFIGKEWADHLLSIFNRYFSLEKEGFSFFQEKMFLLKELKGTFSFPSIKRYLASCSKEKRGVRRAKNLVSLTFRSLRPGIISSSKIIALLGMDEGAYPRPFIPSSLNFLGRGSDYCPTPPDKDRYLFLQALMSAQEAFWITYQNINDEDGKERPPSVLLQDLDPKVELHPPFPFDRSYFSRPRVYPMHYYRAARMYYEKEKKAPFIPEYLHATPLPKPQKKETPTLQNLSRFAKNPLRFYFNHLLNLYLHYEESTDEEFFLSPLQSYQLAKEEKSIDAALKHGRLPLGRFKEIAEKKVYKNWEGVKSLRTYPYPLKNFKETVQVAKEGFPFLGTSKLHDLVKIYPLYLALCIENPMPLVLLKENKKLELKKEPQKALEDYLDYYFLACEIPSPMIPPFAEALLKKDEIALALKIKKASPDPYLTLIFESSETYDPRIIFSTWAPLLRKTFAPLLEISS